MNHEGTSFLSGCAPFHDMLFFAKMDDELAAQDKPQSLFFMMNREKWGRYKELVSWPAMGMTTRKLGKEPRLVVAVGPNGAFWELFGPSAIETVGFVGQKVTLRTVVTIGDAIFACGMGRVVFERVEAGQWRPVGPETPKTADMTVIGFEDMAGFSETEIYAVGWHGEIWRWDRKTWRQIDSPASANLNAVTCGGDGVVYAVGDGGVMLMGRNDEWTVVETGRRENLMDVAWYDNSVYVVTDFRIFTLQNGRLVEDTNFASPEARPTTCLHLLAADGGLFSLGPKDVLRRTTGPWERLA
jgi:hypothetical protein